jgi:hypothetical protein
LWQLIARDIQNGEIYAVVLPGQLPSRVTFLSLALLVGEQVFDKTTNGKAVICFRDDLGKYFQ